MHSNSLPIRRNLELAQAAINQQRPNTALELLKAIQYDINRSGDALLVAEHRLLLADAFAGRRDPAAEYAFQEAIELLEQIDPRPLQLLLRAFEHYGNLLRATGAPSKASKWYSSALQIATELRLREDKDRVHLKLVLIKLEAAKDPEINNFTTMKRVAGDHGYSSAEQLLVWMAHQDGIGKANRGLRAARNRNVADDRYFEDLFQDMRRSSKTP